MEIIPNLTSPQRDVYLKCGATQLQRRKPNKGLVSRRESERAIERHTELGSHVSCSQLIMRNKKRKGGSQSGKNTKTGSKAATKRKRLLQKVKILSSLSQNVTN